MLEASTRIIDGYELASLELGAAQTPLAERESVEELSKAITFTPDVDSQLIFSLPNPVVPGSPAPELLARRAIYNDMSINYVWNENYVASTYFNRRNATKSGWDPFWFQMREPVELSMFAAPWGTVFPR